MTLRLVGALLAVAILLFGLTRVAVHYAFLAIAAYSYPIVDPVVETFRIPEDAATLRRVQVESSVGTLHIAPGAADVLGGTAHYNVAEFAPSVQYDLDGAKSQVLMRHAHELEPARLIGLGERINDWDLALATQAPYTSLEMALGAGEATFDLSGITADHANLVLGTGELALTTADAPFVVGQLTITVGTGEATYDLGGVTAQQVSLEVGTGEIALTTADAPFDTGELTVTVGLGEAQLDLRQSRFISATMSVGMGDLLVDLRADWQHDTHAVFESGVGNITLILPEEVGVRVLVRGGFGAIETVELAVLAMPEEMDGTVYVNTAYATSPVTVDLIAERGIGTVSLLTAAPTPEQGVQ
jgi:hypothetical protein